MRNEPQLWLMEGSNADIVLESIRRMSRELSSIRYSDFRKHGGGRILNKKDGGLTKQEIETALAELVTHRKITVESRGNIPYYCLQWQRRQCPVLLGKVIRLPYPSRTG